MEKAEIQPGEMFQHTEFQAVHGIECRRVCANGGT